MSTSALKIRMCSAFTSEHLSSEVTPSTQPEAVAILDLSRVSSQIWIRCVRVSFMKSRNKGSHDYLDPAFGSIRGISLEEDQRLGIELEPILVLGFADSTSVTIQVQRDSVCFER